MKQHLFEQRHAADWQRFDECLSALEKGKAERQACERFANDYRHLCQHLALAEERGYSSHLIDQLQQLAMRGHQQFYRHRSHLGAQIIRFVIAGFPQLVRHEWRAVLAGCLLFFGALIGMGLLTYLFPELIYSLIAPEQVREMERMYDPGAQRIGLNRAELEGVRHGPSRTAHRQHEQIKATHKQFHGDQSAGQEPPNGCIGHVRNLLHLMFHCARIRWVCGGCHGFYVHFALSLYLLLLLVRFCKGCRAGRSS